MTTDEQSSQPPVSAFKVADGWMASLSSARFVGLMSLIVAPSAALLTGSLLWAPVSIVMVLPLAWMRELGKKLRQDAAGSTARVPPDQAGSGTRADSDS